jgi:hypothetical protein
MKELARGTLKAIESEIWLATLSLKLDVLIAALERRYRADRPRAPKGTPDGGRWIDAAGAPRTTRIRTALAANLVAERVGPGDAGLVRHCIYVDMLGRQRTIELNAMVSCRPTYPAAPL